MSGKKEIKDLISGFHCAFRSLILGAFGIEGEKGNGIFVTAWYVLGVLLAFSLRELRSGAGFLSVYSLTLSGVFLIFLVIAGFVIRKENRKNKEKKNDQNKGYCHHADDPFNVIIDDPDRPE